VPATPASTTGLSSEIQDILDTQPGARYLLADLQVHTPLDPAFEPKWDPREAGTRELFARSYLSKATERGIELVGITEHNDVSWIDDLRQAARDLGLHLLPGFEVESKEGIHVLCLFDPDRPAHDLDEVLTGLGLTRAKRQERRLELRSNQAFDELVAFIQEDCGGVCIAAHVESDKGLLKALRAGARGDFWKTPALTAVQTAKPPNQIESGNGRIIRGEDANYQRDRLPACLLTSDARSFATIGTKATWIKMDTVGVEGLRQAFLDPGSRISYGDPRARHEGGHILAVGWDGDFLDRVRFPLNAELNCLIGGKGTGKSTVLESIRYAFDLPYRTEEVKEAAQTLLANAFRSGSKISVVIETDSPARKRFLVERTAPHAPVVRDRNGDPRPELGPRELLRPCIYGQKEIYGIAQNAYARLELLDGFAADELRDVLEAERGALDAVQGNSRQITDTRRRIDDADDRLAELPNLEEWRARFREAGFEDLLRERRQLDREERLLARAGDALQTRIQQLRSMSSEGAPLAAAVTGGDEQLPNADLLEHAHDLLSNADESWQRGVLDLEAALVDVDRRFAEVRTRWVERRKPREAEFDEALRQLQERMPDVDPERYLDVERRIEQLTPLGAARKQLRERLETLHSERSRLIVELDDARGKKHRVRGRAAKRLNDALKGNVVVELSYQGERESFLQRLGALKSGVRQEALRRLVEHTAFTPSAFVAALRARELPQRFAVPQGPASALERSIDEPTALDLEAVELPDRVELTLDVSVSGTPDRRALDRLSPGQKSTAILLLIMQESKDPLLVDQPEDDLDNRFIYDDVVKRLREAKPFRQFLIATHNANIPVLGDAEQIITLDAEERGGVVSSKVRARGSIDDSAVRDSAEHILEGGREAFDLRSRKYHA